MEKFVNNFITTLTSALGAGVTTASLATITGLPATGNFRIAFKAISTGVIEWTLCTASGAGSVTIVRGQEGSANVAHSIADTEVSVVLTAGAVTQVIAEQVTVGNMASVPTAARTGLLYLPTNGGFNAVHDNGSTQDYFIDGIKVTPPVGASYSWVNQGSATVSTANGGFLLSTPALGGVNMRLYIQGIPAAPYKFRANVSLALADVGYTTAGVCLYDSGSGKIAFNGIYKSVSPGISHMQAAKMNSTTSYNGGYRDFEFTSGLPKWWSIEDDGTNRYWRYSLDGVQYIDFWQSANNDFLTPDHIGFFFQSNNTDSPAMLWVRSVDIT